MDSDALWITSKSSNVVVHPFKGSTLIADACIGGSFCKQSACLREAKH